MSFFLSIYFEFQSTLRKQTMRAIILEKLYQWSLTPYQAIKKNPAWDVGIEDLLQYQQNTLGHQMGRFLLDNNFDLQEKLESHDVFHVLTNTGITVPEEISMQFYLLGNGKRSLYLCLVILLGGILYCDYARMFYSRYCLGKLALPFHQLNFFKLLDQPLTRIKSTFLIP